VFGLNVFALDQTRTVDSFAAADASSSATVIQTPVLYWDQSVSAGTLNTNAAGDDNLLAFLNSSYDSGNGIGKFVVVRLADDGGAQWYKQFTVAGTGGSNPPLHHLYCDSRAGIGRDPGPRRRIYVLPASIGSLIYL